MQFSTILVLFPLFVLPVFSQAPTGSTAAQPDLLAAIGISVSNLEKSRDFYTSTLGLREVAKYDTTQFSEVVLSYPGKRAGASLVLVKWKIPKETKDLAIKLGFFVQDVKVSIDKMRAKGATITMEPGLGKVGNVTLPTGLAKDPDGYVVELNPVTFLSSIQVA